MELFVMLGMLTVGVLCGMGLMVMMDPSRLEPERFAALGKPIELLGKRIKENAGIVREQVQERTRLWKELKAVKAELHSLKNSITQHTNEIQLLETAFTDGNISLQSTKRVRADAAIVFGRGSEWVYLYTFPAHEELARTKRQQHYPMKLGMSTQDNVVTRVDQQVAGNSTALSERAIIRLAFRVNRSGDMEQWMHQQLDAMGRKVKGSVGVEWYYTNPVEVEQLFRSFVLRFSRKTDPVI